MEDSRLDLQDNRQRDLKTSHGFSMSFPAQLINDDFENARNKLLPGGNHILAPSIAKYQPDRSNIKERKSALVMKRSQQPRLPAAPKVERNETATCYSSLQQDADGKVLFQTQSDYNNLNNTSAYGTGRYNSTFIRQVKPKRNTLSRLASSCAGGDSSSTNAYDLTPKQSYQARDQMMEKPGWALDTSLKNQEERISKIFKK